MDGRVNLVLDTSAYSHFRTGHPVVHRHMTTADAVALPATVLGELHAAFKLGGRERENEAGLSTFLEEPFVRTLTIGPDTARHYGTIFASLRRAGTPIPLNDIWIAASTLEHGGHLLTFDRDFERVENLSCTVLSP